MDQLTFKFPFKTTYFEKDFYVSSNNFNAYKLIEEWNKLSNKNINIFGPKGCGKTHLSNIFLKKIDSFIIDAKDLNENQLKILKIKKCIIIDNYQNNIDENFFYSALNLMNQTEKFVIINSIEPIRKTSIKLKDLRSRLDSFIDVGIGLPTDDLLRVIITKSFSDKQIEIDVKLLEYILKNIERSYDKIFQFTQDVDIASLAAGKSINTNLIKKVLNKL
jgi:chromosomal replication initiation ATPase DnaA